MAKKKKGQEEIIGFAMIMVIVVIVILFFLVFALKRDSGENVQSYEVDNFIQSMLQYTTTCDNYFGNYSIQELIFQCENGKDCLNEQNSCDILNSTVRGILQTSWDFGESSPIKGYDFDLSANADEILQFLEGNKTNNYKSALQEFTKGSYSVRISMQVYY